MEEVAGVDGVGGGEVDAVDSDGDVERRSR
jgi:hypothetical protein